jgi:PPOX class probable F420-dependent enzyme
VPVGRRPDVTGVIDGKSGSGRQAFDVIADASRPVDGQGEQPFCALALPTMDLDKARDILRAQHHAVLATVRSDGEPQMSPVLVTLDADGYSVISSRETAYKVRNLRRDPRAWLCSLPDGFFGNWIQVEGPAEIVSLPEAMDGLVAYYRSISGEHPDWEEYRRAMRAEKRCLIRIRGERAGPDRAG